MERIISQPSLARPIASYSPIGADDYDIAISQLKPGERLYAIANDLFSDRLLRLHDRAEFILQVSRFEEGNFLTFTLYAIREE